MEFRDLETFVLAARYLNFHRVAEALYITQPTVSGRIHLLEQEWGESLFIRENRKVRLTPFGEYMLPLAEQILNNREQFIQEMHAFLQGEVGEIIFGGDLLTNTYLTPKILSPLISLPYKWTIKIINLPVYQILQSLKKGDIHIGIIRQEINDPSIEKRLLFEDTVHLVGKTRESVSLPIIWNKNSWYWQQNSAIHQFLDEHPHRIEVDSVDVAKQLILQGLGVGFLPSIVYYEDWIKGNMVLLDTVDIPMTAIPVYLISLKESIYSPFVEEQISTLFKYPWKF